MTRYHHRNMEEVWLSFEWLLRSKLEELDHLSRQLYKDMQSAGAKPADIEAFLPGAFSELWSRVAAAEDSKIGRVRGA
ncbi:hypothetical protein GXP70_12335 [Paenibacillus lycopersici]|uniref:Uncharacterized protein n=1 Tax=Paenibacillus lycopersici TaxID=2704462 RepID=A0A6C0G0C7_9BACL|nr:hypothetical protein [Paenibacillus lycopersici]QHT60649.1 hypothetical protein GXP70_12335 [Paenibacillus lycopersici]